MKKLTITISIIIIISIISLVIGANVIRTNIANERYNSANSNSSSSNLLPEYIKEGITLGGITGTLVDLDTSDATALPEDIIKGKTAYVKGVKITGTKFMVNPPKIMTGMTPIKFAEPTTSSDGYAVDTTQSDKEWYDYENKKWANARTEDGSMWVWVPRFAYRINQETETTEVVFLVGTSDDYYDENGNKHTAKRCTGTDDVVDTTTGYTVHPAFTNESNIGYRNGGWREELTGIWVAKFEAAFASGGNSAQVKASSVNYTQSECWATAIESKGYDSSINADGVIPARNWLDGQYGSNITSIKYPTFQGSSYSINYISIGDAYSISRVLTEDGNIYGLTGATDSHLIKTSEWGAVAYLSTSQYGIGTADIGINTKNLNNGGVSTTKAQGNNLASVYSVTGYNDSDKEWNDYLGSSKSASTTGNIYGIYDMSGGEWEAIPAYLKNGNSNLERGKSFTNYVNSQNYQTNNTEYAVTYNSSETGNTIDEKKQSNFETNSKIYGDAIIETSDEGINNTNWNSGASSFPTESNVFTVLGGSGHYDENGGLFYYSSDGVMSGFHIGFRSVLV